MLGSIPTREVTVYAEQVAANAVMAGCRAEYMPVVVAAVHALLEDRANFHGTTGTLTGAAHGIIVNGPIRSRLEIACRGGCMGPGFQANATIGRALRLVIRNVGKAVPGFLDRAAFSSPLRYSFCFGENEEDSPWAPLHVERGLDAGSDAVTLVSIVDMLTAASATSQPEAICDAIAQRAAGSIYNDAWLAENNAVVVVGMDHMRVFADAGWSKQRIRERLFARIGRKADSARRGIFLDGVIREDGILVVAAGGPGIGETRVLTPHISVAITRPIEPPSSPEFGNA